MAGIFQNGVWCCGFDFLPRTTVTAGGVFDVGSTGGGSPTVSTAAARYTGAGLTIANTGGFIGRSFGTNLVSVYIGFAFLTTALPSAGLIGVGTLFDATAGATQQVLAYDSNGRFGFYQAGGAPNFFTTISGLIAQSGVVIIPNSYMFVEILSTTNNTTGQLTLRVNNSTVISFSGDTQQTANAYTNRFYPCLTGASATTTATHQFDDLYILDTTGAAPLNTFLGNGHIQTDGPNADSASGGLNQWAFTTPQGSDFANAANIPPNAAQYDSDGTLNDRMSFRFPSLTAAQVYFLNAWISCEEDAAGVRGITPIYRSSGVDQTGTAINLPGTFTYFNQNSVTDPNTSASWFSGTVAAAGNCEIGVQVTT